MMQNFLSFGLRSSFELEPLNIVIGPNGVGKSNLIKAIEIVKSLPIDLSSTISRVGNAEDYIWKGNTRQEHFEIDVLFDKPIEFGYGISCKPSAFGYYIDSEGLASEPESTEESISVKGENFIFLRKTFEDKGITENLVTREIDHNKHLLTFFKNSLTLREEHVGDKFRMQEIKPNQSFFQGMRDNPFITSNIRRLIDLIENIRIYGRFDTSNNNSAMRLPCDTRNISEYLLPDGSNLALVLSYFESQNKMVEVQRALNKFNNRINRISTSIRGNLSQIYFSEININSPITSQLVSDGTLCFLILCCILMNQGSSSLVCIEEPECGLHPDAIPLLAEMIREASEHTQIIITTHSDRLVDCFSDMPEYVVVADRDDVSGETVFERLDRSDLKEWLANYRLGKLWTKGQIGGVLR